MSTSVVFGHLLITRVLLAAGASVERCAHTDVPLLLLGAATGDVALIEALLAAGCELQPKNCESPVFAATQRGHYEAVKRLLAAGADVDADDTYGYTPLMVPAVVGDMKMAKLLVDAGADVMRETRDGHSAAQLAAEHGHREVYEYLVKCMSA